MIYLLSRYTQSCIVIRKTLDIKYDPKISCLPYNYATNETLCNNIKITELQKNQYDSTNIFCSDKLKCVSTCCDENNNFICEKDKCDNKCNYCYIQRCEVIFDVYYEIAITIKYNNNFTREYKSREIYYDIALKSYDGYYVGVNYCSNRYVLIYLLMFLTLIIIYFIITT